MQKWAEKWMRYERMEREARREKEEALDLRCAMRESGGYRCTADVGQGHAHRYDMTEIPASVEEWAL